MTQLATDNLSEVLAQQLAQNRYLDSLRTVGTIKVAGIIEHVLECYTRWADGRQEEKLADCRDFLTNVCSAMSITVVETAYALYALRDGLLDNIAAEAGAGKNESREKAAKFFDLLVVQLMRGY